MINNMAEIPHRPGIAILASGSGSTAEAFINATRDGRVDAEVGLVISNNPSAEVLDRVANLCDQYGIAIETLVINSKTHPKGNANRGQTDEESSAICEAISRRNLTHVALMGYMKRVGGELIDEYGWRPDFTSIYQARMSNTHPGPLPETEDTYGIGTQERVVELGLTASRHTVHLVSSGIDKGPKIAEHPFEIKPGSSPKDIFERVQDIEKATLPYVLDNFLKEQAAYQNGNS